MQPPFLSSATIWQFSFWESSQCMDTFVACTFTGGYRRKKTRKNYLGINGDASHLLIHAANPHPSRKRRPILDAVFIETVLRNLYLFAAFFLSKISLRYT